MQDKFRRNIKYKKIFSREFTGGFFIFVLFKMEPLQPFSQIICIGKAARISKIERNESALVKITNLFLTE
jgi:hypothetical protein